MHETHGYRSSWEHNGSNILIITLLYIVKSFLPAGVFIFGLHDTNTQYFVVFYAGISFVKPTGYISVSFFDCYNVEKLFLPLSIK